VRDLLGHASINTTERYDNQKPENLQAAAARLERGETFDPCPRDAGSPSICRVFVKSEADREQDERPHRVRETAPNANDEEHLEKWRGGRDSNPDNVVQSRRWTIAPAQCAFALPQAAPSHRCVLPPASVDEGRSIARQSLFPDRFVESLRCQDRNVGCVHILAPQWIAPFPHNCPLRGPGQKAGIDQRIDDVTAIIRPKRPAADRLRQRHLQLGHLHEIDANAIDQGCEAHDVRSEQRPGQSDAGAGFSIAGIS
jgi:hypothetical protein